PRSRCGRAHADQRLHHGMPGNVLDAFAIDVDLAAAANGVQVLAAGSDHGDYPDEARFISASMLILVRRCARRPYGTQRPHHRHPTAAPSLRGSLAPSKPCVLECTTAPAWPMARSSAAARS